MMALKIAGTDADASEVLEDMQQSKHPDIWQRWQPASFRPAPWLPGRHAQTIAGRLMRRPRQPEFIRERFETPDGDFVDVDVPRLGPQDAPLVLLLHGLEGSARRGYAIHTYFALAERGLRGAGLNFRSCSGVPNRTARFYHSGETQDLRWLLGQLEARLGAPAAGAIGFSLGGNVLLKYLAEEGEDAAITAAVAVSVPYDLSAGADALDRTPMGRFYTNIFLQSLVAKTVAKLHLVQDSIDVERLRRARSFREFDDTVTAPLHGFAGAADYYARSSSGPLLDRIRRPVVLLHADDDPFLPMDALPRAVIEANPHLRLVVTRGGGHVGFVRGTPWRPRFWAEDEAARFLASALDTLRDGA